MWLRERAAIPHADTFFTLCAMHPRGRDVVLGTNAEGWVERWSIGDGALRPLARPAELEGFEPGLARYTYDGALLLLGGSFEGGYRVSAIDAESDAFVATLAVANLTAPYWIQLSHPTRRVLVTSHDDPLLAFWSFEPPKPRVRRRKPNEGAFAAFTRDGRWLVQFSDYHETFVRLDAETWEEADLGGPDRPAVDEVFGGAGAGEVMTLRRKDRIVDSWDVASLRHVRSVRIRGDEPPRSFAPFGRYAVTTEGRTLVAYELSTGEPFATIPLRTRGDHTWESFSADGRLFASAGYDSRVFEVGE